ncbi:hypothetical protein N7476_011592 [Penicillium atrosanguineum]|uniref:Amidohydrolase-related domain-containing protein n=1 Tax=Penicillium atrosanguineum TaxID=1132637 RepID=A0A9W9U1R0_9EURO|nr:hypothetical protein N7476_011592 [Penicillium atrosanguineum]
MSIRLVGIEEHFLGRVFNEGEPSSREAAQLKMFPGIQQYIADLGEARIAMMDRGAMDIQVLAEAVKASKGWLRGFGLLSMAEVDAIPAELERCVKDMAFVGAQIPNHAEGVFYDGREYWPMFAKAQELDVPIYFYPTIPTELEMKGAAGDYDQVATKLISGAAWGWHMSVGYHMLRLYCAGVFDAYPRLKIVIGHNGEGLPFMLDRIHRFFSKRWTKGKPQRDWLTVWNENFWVTTAGMFHLGPLQCVLAMCKSDRILYSLDYPFEDPEEGFQFMKSFQESGMVSQEQFEKICHGNAERLLRL